MKDTFFSLHNLISFSVSGKGSLADYIKFQFKSFQSTENRKTNSFKIYAEEQITNDGSGAPLKDGNIEFKRDQNKFIINYKGQAMSCDGTVPLYEQKYFSCEKSFNKMFFNKIIDLKL